MVKKLYLITLLIAAIFFQGIQCEVQKQDNEMIQCYENETCLSALIKCQNQCLTFNDEKLKQNCLIQCATIITQQIDHLESKNQSDNNTITNEQMNDLETNDGKYMKIDQQKYQKFLEDPHSHDGQSLLKIDCDRVKTKKKVALNIMTPAESVKNYFKSRCDFEIVNKNSKDFDFKWTSFQRYQNFKKLKSGKQIINHIGKVKELLSDKDNLVKTLKKFDKKNLYNFNSNDIHFKTFQMNLKSETYNEEELAFMNEPNKGLWLTKNPSSSVGLGIKIYNDLEEIKQNVREIKASSKNGKVDKAKIKQFSFIQEYMDKPLLKNGKKLDLRVYMLVASLDPFVLLYQDGWARSCILPYDTDISQDEDWGFKHLSNKQFQYTYYKNNKEKVGEHCFSSKEVEEFLKNEKGLSDEKLEAINHESKKVLAYTFMAAKDRLKHQQGAYQVMGADLIYDEDYNVKIIELNTNPGLKDAFECQSYVIAQMVQSTLDLVTETLYDPSTLREKWSHPEKLELGRWQIVINEATGYNILDQYLVDKKSDDKQKRIEL
ncbi:hypothetical protein PPERSA_09404 [Pseudocohnilembus persalinus]|uniref:Tubulin-tyrosine ligase family protein n=1 Tax=Pseudocohnilembus persalinus TaxID=266149 RepID=A0A0V0R520_PSEPJ|nr:hypothetical protein PPERSA_09404 [Pseudocohnilembus persalinus]|eukprot:KRX09574.1 hypothetical protein PPERSA_09404 [Pseudocohnilembus persalinus]